MQTKTISQGESFTFTIVLPENKMPQVEDIVVYCGNKVVAKKSDDTLISTIDANIFVVQLTSNFTQRLRGIYDIITAVDYSDLGIIKVKKENALQLIVDGNNNVFSNESISNASSTTITFSIVNNELIPDIFLATIYRGYSALELYKLQNNNFSLTLADMLEEQNKIPYRVIQVINIHNGSVIEHNLNGIVLCQIVESGQIQAGVWGEYLDDNKVTIRTPFFEDLVNTSYTGYAIITLLQDVYPRKKVIEVVDIQDGNIIYHNLNGLVLMQYIENEQLQGGFYGQFNNQNSVIFKTPSLEGQIFSGTILCTKLS
jgi:hypothetical protein